MHPTTKQKPNLIYALDTDGKAVHIDSVPNGFACDCVCPRCNSKLKAKNGGGERAHHFAHTDGADCVGAVESAIHCLAKDVLEESLCVKLPKDGEVLHFDRVEKEKNFPDLKLRPDCVGYYGDKDLWIEFKRTHEVDARKEGKIVSAQIDCIEIDLKDCEQDKEKLREYITQSSENRKWIFNAQLSIGKLGSQNNREYSDENDGGKYSDERICRHFAIDDSGKLIDFRISSEFDALKHSYSCPNCKQEIVLKSDDKSNYAFYHLEENYRCDDEMYLKCAAAFAVQQAYSNSSNFVIEVPQFQTCKHHDKCSFCNSDCQVQVRKKYDLKSLCYFHCQKDYKFDDVRYQTDLVFYRDDIRKDSIEIRFNTENFELELETPRRAIDIAVHCEHDVCRLEKGLLGYESIRYLNFASITYEKAEPKEINHSVLKYTIYSSGKIHIGPVTCTQLSKSQVPNVLKEGIFIKTNGVVDEMYDFLLLHYKDLWSKVCRCRLCCYLKKNEYQAGNSVCIRYKKVGTPKNPLMEKVPPKACPYFRMNYDKKSRENEISSEMKIVEM